MEEYDEDALGEQTVTYKGYSIRVKKMQSGKMQPVCVFSDDWPKVLLAAGIEEPTHADESFKSKPHKKREFTPGSDDLERTGCSRKPTVD
jgi:hypothetical protein